MSRILLLLAFLLSLHATHALAADYDTVASDAPLYQHLQTVAEAGWTNTGGVSRSGSANALTRYEISLEAAKAIFTVTARCQSKSDWERRASRQALKALRELTIELRPELQRLAISVPDTLRQIDAALAKSEEAGVLTAQWSTLPDMLSPTGSRTISTTGRIEPTQSTPGKSTLSGDAPAQISPAGIPISRRLQLHTALTAAAREQASLDRASWLARDETSPREVPSSANSINAVTTVGAAFAVNNWLRLRADWTRQENPVRTTLPALLMSEQRPLHARGPHSSLGGGLDLSLSPSLTISGEIAHVAGDDIVADRDGLPTPSGTRIGGGLGLSAWQNRLVLNANLARLIPQQESDGETSTAEVDLGVNVSQNLRLRLLYQQLFGPQTQTRAERLIAGGVSVRF